MKNIIVFNVRLGDLLWVIGQALSYVFCIIAFAVSIVIVSFTALLIPVVALAESISDYIPFFLWIGALIFLFWTHFSNWSPIQGWGKQGPSEDLSPCE